MKVYFAADHAGFALKNELLTYVGELGYKVEDCGALEDDPDDDYPSIIATAARRLAADANLSADSCAILIGASGEGEAMVANRFKGVRCALYYGSAAREQTDMSGQILDILTSSRQHNHANALSLGARFLSTDEAKEAVRSWLSTPFSEEDRHIRRVEQIDEVT
jgi:ribose 5-phosphate isomerase B